MDLSQKLKEAKAKRKEIVERVNTLVEEIERIRERRQTLLQDALRFDGEVRILEALIKEEKEASK